MSWNPPQTWVTSQLVTAADLNTDLRDNLNYLYDRANWDSASSASNFTITSTTYAQVGTLSVTLTTIGNPVLLILEVPTLKINNESYLLYVQWYNATTSTYQGSEYNIRVIDGTPTTLIAIQQPSTGTYTWHIRAKVNNASGSGTISKPILHAIELL